MLEVVGHEGGELGAVFGRDVVEAAVDGAAEFGEVVVVTTVKHVAFDELPQPFDQIQIRGIRRQELQSDVDCLRRGLERCVCDVSAIGVCGVGLGGGSQRE